MTAKTKKKDPVHPRHLSLDERLDRLVEQAEADRDSMAEFKVGAEALLKSVNEDRKENKGHRDNLAQRAEADRDSMAQLGAKVDKFVEAVERDHKKSEGHRDNLARALEDEFAASLPRAMREAHGIVIKPEDVRMRVRKDNQSPEFDFIAPNGELVLAGEVKTHLTLKDVDAFFGRLDCDFREMFPEYAGLPVHGVVAGAVIDEPAALRARKRGFVILRLEGAEVHPATVGGKFQPRKY